jgi:hypothetical protein
MVLRVRDLTLEEGEKLRHIVRHGQDAIELKRAQIVLAGAQGNTPPRIEIIALKSEDYIRGVVRAFHEHGIAMLRPKWGPGRPPKFTDDQRKALVAFALRSTSEVPDEAPDMVLRPNNGTASCVGEPSDCLVGFYGRRLNTSRLYLSSPWRCQRTGE